MENLKIIRSVRPQTCVSIESANCQQLQADDSKRDSADGVTSIIIFIFIRSCSIIKNMGCASQNSGCQATRLLSCHHAAGPVAVLNLVQMPQLLFSGRAVESTNGPEGPPRRKMSRTQPRSYNRRINISQKKNEIEKNCCLYIYAPLVEEKI